MKTQATAKSVQMNLGNGVFGVDDNQLVGAALRGQDRDLGVHVRLRRQREPACSQAIDEPRSNNDKRQ